MISAAVALPAALGAWAQILGTLFAAVVLIGGAVAVLRQKQWAAERIVLKQSIETLEEGRRIDREEWARQQARHDEQMADLRAQLGVLHSDFLAGLAESIVTAVIDTLHPLLPTAPVKRQPPRKASR